jgi:hypothetical protein
VNAREGCTIPSDGGLQPGSTLPALSWPARTKIHPWSGRRTTVVGQFLDQPEEDHTRYPDDPSTPEKPGAWPLGAFVVRYGLTKDSTWCIESGFSSPEARGRVRESLATWLHICCKYLEKLTEDSFCTFRPNEPP